MERTDARRQVAERMSEREADILDAPVVELGGQGRSSVTAEDDGNGGLVWRRDGDVVERDEYMHVAVGLMWLVAVIVLGCVLMIGAGRLADWLEAERSNDRPAPVQSVGMSHSVPADLLGVSSLLRDGDGYFSLLRRAISKDGRPVFSLMDPKRLVDRREWIDRL